MKVPYRFKVVYDILPEAEKNLPICIIDDKRYTWKEVYKELEDESYLGKKMLVILTTMKFIPTIKEWIMTCRTRDICYQCGDGLICPSCDSDKIDIEELCQDSARDSAEARREAYD